MKKFEVIVTVLVLMFFGSRARAQEGFSGDTLQCHIIGFGVGVMGALDGGSTSWGGLEGGNMADLYDSPYLNFSIDCAYKYKTGWMVTLDGDFWFGLNSDNLKFRSDRMSDIYTSQGYAMGWGGYDGVVTCYNRGFSARLGVGKLLTLLPGNANSGISLRMAGGWYLQQTKFVQDYTEATFYALNGDYAKLYDHLRNGLVLTEGVGLWYMHNSSTFVNVKLEFTISEYFGWSSRPYVIDGVMGLKGEDKNTYLDLVYGLKLTWMFPLTGKTTHEYYYF